MSEGVSEVHEKLGVVLSKVYVRVDWKTMSSQKRPRDTVFMDRVKRARNAGDVIQAVERLCKSLNVSGSNVEASDLEVLMVVNDQAMMVWREHHDYLAMKASALARECWDAAKIEQRRQTKLAEA